MTMHNSATKTHIYYLLCVADIHKYQWCMVPKITENFAGAL